MVTAARRIAVPYPILLVIGGLALGLVPGLPHPDLDPELVLVIFLPPLLYIAGYFTPFRDFRANRRPIALLAIGLPLFTIGVVTAVARTTADALHIGGLTWAAAFALGAIVSPTDAIAATAIFRQLGVPRRIVTLLEGESLLNDAVALVAWRSAVAAAATGVFVLADATRDFFLAAGGGIAIGLGVGWVAARILDRLDDPPVEVALSLVVPFAAFLPAEQTGLSGVLAAVTVGLYLGQRSARRLSSDTRLLGDSTWEILTFVINGFAFILIGLQLPTILAGLADRPPGAIAVLALTIALSVTVARLMWLIPATYLPRMVVRGIRENDPAPPLRAVFVIGWSGMRGVVSLAAALALPADFPERALIQFITFTVIVVTLVGQGLTLPAILRHVGLTDDGSAGREENEAREVAAEAALRELGRLRHAWPGHLELIDQLEGGYRHRALHLPSAGADADAEMDQELIEHQAIRSAVIAAECGAVLDLRDRGSIDDETLRRIQHELDLAQARMEA